MKDSEPALLKMRTDILNVIGMHVLLIGLLLVVLLLLLRTAFGLLGLYFGCGHWSMSWRGRTDFMECHPIVGLLSIIVLLPVDVGLYRRLYQKKGKQRADIYAFVVSVSLAILVCWYIYLTCAFLSWLKVSGFR